MKKILSLLIMSFVILSLGVVSAVHTASIEVSPENWLLQSTSYDFEFTVENAGPDSINDVTIDGNSNFGDLICGTAPDGWTLYTSTVSYCRYTTNIVDDFIASGEDEVFEVTAPTLSDFGEQAWLITTRESGEVGTQNNNVYSIVQTIQNAIDDADPEDTITVPAGTYDESIIIDKELTLVGDGEVIISGDDSTYNYIVKITADDVIFDNFEVNGGGSETGDNVFDYGIWISDTDSVEITNSIVKNIWKNQGNGIRLDDSSDSIIHNNVISSFQKRGIIYINSDGEFYNNEVIGDHIDGTDRVQNLVNVNGGSNVEVYNNLLHGALSIEETPTWDSPGIVVSSYDWSSNDISSYANIYDNEIYDCDSGIVIGSVYSNADSSTADITNNDLHDLGLAINFEVDRLSSGQNDVSAVIHENVLTDNVMAIGVEGTETTTTINAEDNWWGTAVESEIDELIDGDVDFDPWCYESTCSLEEPQEWVVPLFTGMNFFSIPLMPESVDIEDVLPEEVSDNAEKIWSYQEGEWEYNTPTTSGWSTVSSRIQEIIPGYGYIIFMTDDTIAYGNGREIGAAIPTEEIELTPGWNMIGHRGLEEKQVWLALSSIDLGDNYRWDIVLELNPEGDGYVELANYWEADLEVMESTKAYWVSVITNDGPIYL